MTLRHARHGFHRLRLPGRALFLGLALSLLATWSALPVQAAEFQRLFESARGLGLGNAYSASASSFDAMLYNPAGLMMHQYWKVEGRNYTSRSEDAEQYFVDLDAQAGRSQNAVEDFMSQDGNQPHHERSFALGGYHNETGWGIALFESTVKDSDPISDDETLITNDRIYGGIWTQAYTSENRLALWGFNLRFMGRAVSSDVLTAEDISDSGFSIDENDRTSTGNDWDADIGLILRLPSRFFRPQLALSVLNLNSAEFGLSDYDSYKTETNVGIAFFPDLFETVQVMVTGEVRDASQNAFADDDRDIIRSHSGVELSFFKISDGLWGLQVRGGSSQGLPSFGATVNLGHYLSAEIATYEERLIYENEDVRQQRTVAQLRYGF